MDLQQFLMAGGHGLGAAPQAPPPVTEFNAGMLAIKNGRAEADHRRGRIIVDRTSGSRFRIRWVIRPAMNEDWSMTVGVDEFELVRVPECKDARVYRMKHRSDRTKDKYIWMQEAKESTDAEVVRKFNSTLAPNIRRAGAAGASGATGTSATGSAMQTPATGTSAPTSQRDILRSLLSQVGGTTPDTAGRSNQVQMDLLRAAFAAQMQAQQGSHKSLSLRDILVTDRVMNALSSEALERLAQHLPEGEQEKGNVVTHLRSAQFKTALSRFDGALERAYQPVMAALGITPRGDDFGVAGFIDSVQGAADSTRSTAAGATPGSTSSSSSNTSAGSGSTGGDKSQNDK